MKISRFICAMFAALMPVYVMAATIPKPFHGEWVASDEPPKNCQEIDDKTVITAKYFSGYELGCDITKVTSKRNKAILVNLLCSSEGDSFKDARTLLLKDAKHLEITNENGSQIYQRCPRNAKK